MLALLILIGCRSSPPPEPSQPREPTATELVRPPEEPAAFGSIVLRLAEPPPPLQLDLGPDDVADLLGPLADDLVLLELDPGVLLRAAVQRIRDACGDDWDRDEPSYDCGATALGRTLGPDWQTTPEFAMVRLLTMTPGNAEPTGTSLQGVAGIADALSVGGGFGPVLADTLDKDIDRPAVGTTALVEAIRHGLLASHPQTTLDGRIPITLADALSDLATLGPRLGPMGDHPGVLDPGLSPFGRVLAEDFAMELTVASNLRILDGLDLSEGKGFLVTSTAERPVDLDFVDPERFAIRGLVDEPTIDLRLALTESSERSVACAGDVACYGNPPARR